MLRCLGWNQAHILAILIVKSTLFQMLPGAILGLFITQILCDQIKSYVMNKEQLELYLDIGPSNVLVAAIVAICLPLMASVNPILANLSLQLRDALNIHRVKPSNLSVAITRLQDLYGLSLDQLILGLTLAFTGIMSYVLIPFSLIKGELGFVTILLMLIMVLSIIGLVQML